VDQPVLRNGEVEKLRRSTHEVFQAGTIDCTWPVAAGPDGLEVALERACADAEATTARGKTILILSDRATSAERVPIPSLLAVAAVHHHLVRCGTRLRVGLIRGPDRGVWRAA
jgi:hypothetical protein